MPADHLTTVPAAQLAATVLAVLAGTPLAQVAEQAGIDPANLDDATQLYQAAGQAALERRADEDWYHVRVQFPDWATAEKAGAHELGPRLDHLHDTGALTGWWFLRKHPCWRLRLRGPTGTDVPAAVNPVLDGLAATGTITRWWPTIYEPETAAFGGVHAMHTVHDLFCADSRGVLDYLRRATPCLGRRELSLLLCAALMRASGLDWFEYGDVFDRVAHLRPTPSETDTARIGQLAQHVQALLAAPTRPDSTLFASDGPLAHASSWLVDFQTAGHALAATSDTGRLGRGLRSVLAQILIFHWNRLGLSATTQAILAAAARQATLPGD